MQNSKLKLKNLLLALCIFNSAFSIACSVPNLEAPECTESRGTVKELYSYHFGNDMKFSEENLKRREKYLTPEYFKSLQGLQTESDVFLENRHAQRAESDQRRGRQTRRQMADK
jgi:hypothetical protein